MARTSITPQRITSAGVELSMTAANVDGHSIPMGSGLVLLVRNGDAADKTVTIPTPQSVDGLAVTDRTVTVTAGEDRYIALGTHPVYAQDGGSAWVDFSAVTSVTVALLQV